MTAQVIILPTIRVRGPQEASCIAMHMSLDIPIFDKLMMAAETANSTVEKMAEALIVCGLAQIEQKTPDEFWRATMEAKA